MTYKIFNTHISVAFDSYKHHTSNNIKKLLNEKDGLKNTFIITT